MRKLMEGAIGAACFMAGSIVVYGFVDLIDMAPLEGRMNTEKTYHVAPQVPVTAAIRVDHCKHCGQPVFLPADREPHVLGTLCSKACEKLNREHYE